MEARTNAFLTAATIKIFVLLLCSEVDSICHTRSGLTVLSQTAHKLRPKSLNALHFNWVLGRILATAEVTFYRT